MKLTPKVSVGLPVCNGGKYLKKAIDSILTQTFKDFELIISDNASGDNTYKICKKYTYLDSRIRYVRSEINHGAAWNFNHVADLARGKYFKWMACDDICLPRFLECCLDVLDHNPQTVLCFPGTMDIDEKGRPRGEKKFEMKVADGKVHRRFRDLICINHSCFPIFGLMRTKALRQTCCIGPYVGSDRVLLAELSLQGRFVELKEKLFLHREHRHRSTRAMPNLQERISWFDPTKAGQLTYPNWRMFKEYIRCVDESDLALKNRIACLIQIMPWLKNNYRSLFEDIRYALKWRQKARRDLAVQYAWGK